MTKIAALWANVRCRAVATVDGVALSTLTAAAVDCRLESSRLGCELVAGHDGSHVALAATAQDGDQWWWLRWQGQSHEVIQIDPCAADLAHGPYQDCCTLPDDHAGLHSFDLPPLPPFLEHATPRCPAGQDSSGDGVERGWLARLQNPGNDACACLSDCWCKRTKIGYALRWYTLRRWHRLPSPSNFIGLQRCR
jgi:hypothetical protein